MTSDLRINAPASVAFAATRAAAQDPIAAKPEAAPAAAPSPIANPTLRLNAALGLVVIEFRDGAGQVTSTIPSQRQIEAYRRHDQTLPVPGGQIPSGQIPNGPIPGRDAAGS